MNSASKRVHVAVGVILDAHQHILIALRSTDSHQGGLWEFPGGKVEATENVEQALQRELFEELGLTVKHCRPCVEVQHDYADKSVLLNVWWVDQFSGQPEGREGQPIRWVAAKDLLDYEFPAANKAIISAVIAALTTMPPSIGIK
jgi:8-oxo-dGTP diphosphatase